MKSTTQKIAAILLAIALCIPLFAVTVLADDVPFTGTMALVTNGNFALPVAGESSYRTFESLNTGFTGLPEGARIDAGNSKWGYFNGSGVFMNLGRCDKENAAFLFQTDTDYALCLCIEFWTSGFTTEGMTAEQVTLNGVAASKLDLYSDSWFYAYFALPKTAETAELTFADNAEFDIPSDTAGTSITTFSVTKMVAGGTAPYTYSLEDAPAWLTINPHQGEISGTRPAVSAEATTATVRVTDSASATKTIEIAVGEVITINTIEAFNFVNDSFVAPVTGETTEMPYDFVGGNPFTLDYGQSNWKTAVDLPDNQRFDYIDGYKKKVFEEGVVYFLQLKLEANVGYIFDENYLADYKFNGQSAVAIDVTYGGMKADVYFEMPAAKTYFTEPSITLGSDITVNFYVKDDSYDAPKVKFTMTNDYTKTIEGVKVGSEWKFAFDGVAPQWMLEKVNAELIIDDKTVAIKDGFSVKNYLRALLNKTAAELGYTDAQKEAMDRLVSDLLFYGAAAQSYVGYATGALVNSGILGSSIEELTTTDKAVENNGTYVTFTKANVFFSNTNKINFKFEAADLTGVSFKISVNGGAETEIAYTAVDDYYVITTDDIKATGFDDIYTVTAYKGATKGASATYSVKSYAYSMQVSGDVDMRNLAGRTYNYGLAAKAFVAAIEA